MKKSLSDMIMEQAQTVGALKHDLDKYEASLAEKAAELQEDIDSEELRDEVKSITEVVEEQRAEVHKAESRLSTLKDLEKIQGQKAEQTDPVQKAPPVIKRRKEPDDPVDLLFKTGAIEFLSFVKRQRPEEIMEKHFRDDTALQAVHGYMQKSAVEPADTQTSGWAAELVDHATRGVLESLTDISIAAQLARYAQVLSFNGANQIRVPRVNNRTGAPSEPAWVGEGGAIPLTQFSIASEVINRYKLAAIVPVTEELARSAVTDVVSLFSRELRKDYARQLDAALLSNAQSVAGIRPAGLMRGYTAIAATAGGGGDAVIKDVTDLATALMANNMGERPVLIANRADVTAANAFTSPLGQFQFTNEIQSGTLMGYPLLYSNHVPQHTLILVDTASLALALDTPEFMVSREATVVEASADATAPTMAEDPASAGDIGTAGQVPPDGGLMVEGANQEAGTDAIVGANQYTARSAYQTWSIFVRMVAPTSFARLRDDMLAYKDATTWTS